MRNKKLLFILIPVIIVAVTMIAGIVFIALNSSSEKIFKNSVSKVFGMLETTEENISTMKGKINFTANIESDDENMQAINTMLEGSSIGLNMETDTNNMIVSEKLNIAYNNESLLNASILLQDEKGYIYLPDLLNKYLEIPEEYIDFSEFKEYYEKIDTINQELLLESIEQELIEVISKQELAQKKTTLFLNGQETKVTASTLKLEGNDILVLIKELLVKFKANENFQMALGNCKEDVGLALDQMIQTINETISIETESDNQLSFTIYTKGFFNEFVGVSAKAIDAYYEEASELKLLRHNDGKYEFIVYEGTREEANVTFEDKKESKNKGTATITITVDGEEFVLLYNYEMQGDKETFALSTEIEGTIFSIYGNVIVNDNNFKGNLVFSLQEESIGKINLNCAYDFAYGVQIQKTDTRKCSIN